MGTEIQDRDRGDVDWVTSTEQGRRFYWRILSHCGIYRDIEGTDVEMHKQLGRRQVGLHLLALVSDVSEDRLFKMMQEAKNRAIEEKINHDNYNRNTGSIDHIIGSSTEFPSFANDTGSIKSPIF